MVTLIADGLTTLGIGLLGVNMVIFIPKKKAIKLDGLTTQAKK